MEPQELHERLDEVQLIDVREPWEYDAGHIDQAMPLPLAELPTSIEQVARDRPVALICRSGARSFQATRYLAQHGFDVHNVEGGMQEWDALGHAIVTADGEEGTVV